MKSSRGSAALLHPQGCDSTDGRRYILCAVCLLPLSDSQIWQVNQRGDGKVFTVPPPPLGTWAQAVADLDNLMQADCRFKCRNLIWHNCRCLTGAAVTRLMSWTRPSNPGLSCRHLYESLWQQEGQPKLFLWTRKVPLYTWSPTPEP